MAARDSLGPQFMYHYSPGHGEEGERRVASIKQHGLLTHDPLRGHRSYAEETGGYPAGVYLFQNRDEGAELDEGHLWKVNVKGLKLHRDPYGDEDYAKQWYSKDPVPPHRLHYEGPTR